MADAEAEIRRIIQEFPKHINARDRNNPFFKIFHADDCKQFTPKNEESFGKEAAIKFDMELVEKAVHMKIVTEEVEVYGHAAYIVDRFTLTLPDGKKQSGLATGIMKKDEQGRWRVYREHLNMDPE